MRTYQVAVLAVNITADADWRVNLNERTLRHEDVLSELAELHDLALLHGLCETATSRADVEDFADELVNVEAVSGGGGRLRGRWCTGRCHRSKSGKAQRSPLSS